MKRSIRYFTLLPMVVFIGLSLSLNAQVAINSTGADANPSAMLDVSSTTGGLLVPRMTQQQRESISSPATGLMVFQTDNTKGFYYFNGMSWVNIEVQGNSWGLTGNSGTNPVTDFIGTTDAEDLVFRINNLEKMRLTQKGQLTFLGNGKSVFIGDSAGVADDLSDNENVFIGYKAGMSNNTGNKNVANGYKALYSNTNGKYNVANGYLALYSNISGSYNVVNGSVALSSNQTGSLNVANGYQALFNNQTGSSNIAVGQAALYSNTSGDYNLAIGENSLGDNSTGRDNIALGKNTLLNNTDGDKNIALGVYAGNNIQSGSKNILIGYNVYAPLGNGNNQMSLGNLIFATGVDGEAYNISSGNVGIGVKFPSARLEVNGQVKITGGNPAAGKWLRSDANGLASWDSLVQNEIYDADSNTLIQVEKNTNEDKIRFTMGGTEYLVLDNGRINLKNTGKSVFIGDSAGVVDDLTNNENVFVGYHAGMSNTTGNNNVANGNQALHANTNGIQNVANGSQALYSNIGGSYNVANGFQSLYYNQSGNFNVASGIFALFNNTTGEKNLASGGYALSANTNGKKNIALGYSALQSNVGGDNNIGLGYLAGNNIVFGSNNIVIGYNIEAPSAYGSYQMNLGNLIFATGVDGEGSTLSSGNVGIGVKNPSAKLEVNGQVKISGGNPAVGKVLRSDANGLASWDSLVQNEIYDADSNTLIQVEKNANEDKIRFAMGGTEYLVLDNGKINIKNTGKSVFLGDGAGSGDDLANHQDVYIGYRAGYSNTAGAYNVATGYRSLYHNTAGSYNVAGGYESLYLNTIGHYNISIGYQSLYSNTSGGHNVATGYQSLYSNTGDYNVGYGNLSLAFNTSGYSNVACGWAALNANTTGNSNVAVGTLALASNTTRSSLVAVGDSALYYNGVGASAYFEAATNTAIGKNTLLSNTIGFGNTALGYMALYENTTGYGNTAIGKNALKTGSSYYNCAALGYNAQVTTNNAVRLGDSYVGWIGGHSAWHNTSDGRFKTNINENVAGLDFILKLRPVTYTWDLDKMDKFMGVSESYSPEMVANHKKSSQIVHTGFIAQEVEQAAKETGFNFDGIHHPDNQKDMYSLAYGEFVVPLVKAVQQLAGKNEQLTVKMEEQNQTIEQQNQTILQLKEQLTELQQLKKRMERLENKISR